MKNYGKNDKSIKNKYYLFDCEYTNTFEKYLKFNSEKSFLEIFEYSYLNTLQICDYAYLYACPWDIFFRFTAVFNFFFSTLAYL